MSVAAVASTRGPALDRVLARFPDAKRVGREWRVRCPAHEDHAPSLDLSQGDRGVVLTCRAGCSSDAVVEALDRHHGLTKADLFDEPPRASRKRIVSEHPYTDEQGTLLSQKVRFEPKGFSQRRPDGAGGWTHSLDGVRRVLYRLPQLIEADPNEIVWVVEGEKDADNLTSLGLVATTNVEGAGKWRAEYSEDLRNHHVVILPDNDKAGEEHGLKVARSLSGIAASVRVVRLLGLPVKGDVTDWLDAGGTAEELRRLADATPVFDAAAATDASASPSQPEIVVGPDESRVIDEAIAALGTAPEIYVRGGALAEVIEDDPATRGVTRGGPVARIVACPEPRVRELMARSAAWLGSDGAGGHRPIHPTQWAVRGVMARGRWAGIRPIAAVATAPTLRPDGSLLDRPGYDPTTAIFLSPSVSVAVDDRPTLDDARHATAALLDVVCDFPLEPAGKAAWLSGVLTSAARHAIDGSTPLILVDASTRGSGKTLLADAASTITSGRQAARMIFSHDDAEMRKVITAVALAGDSLVLLDNVVGELGCPALDAVLTAGTWRDRILGASALTSEIPMRIVWWATGNGVIVGADLVRRALLVRLEPRCERPEERTGFRYPRLLEHVRADRPRLLAAALTIVRAYVVAGRPDMQLTPMGSYEAWSDLIRSALVWAGQSDPCSTIADLRAANPGDDALRVAMDRWPGKDGAGFTAADLIRAASDSRTWREALVEWVPPRGGADLPTARALGYALRAIRGRIVASQMVAGERDRTGTAVWVKKRIGGAGDAGHEGDESSVRGGDPFVSHRVWESPSSHASPAGNGVVIGGDDARCLSRTTGNQR